MNVSLIKRMLNNYITTNDEIFDNFYNSLLATYKKGKNIKNITDPELIGERIKIASDSKELGFNLIIIALYCHTEISIKFIWKSFFNYTDSIIESLSSFNNLKKHLNDKGIKIEGLDKYASYNELRLLCNSIKHCGSISKGLSFKYLNWKKGDEFKNINETYLRLYPEVKIFLIDLINKCAECDKNKYREPLGCVK